jgi:hypothetical protein
MLLTGSRTTDELRRAPRVVGPTLERWLRALEAQAAGQPEEAGPAGRAPAASL